MDLKVMLGWGIWVLYVRFYFSAWVTRPEFRVRLVHHGAKATWIAEKCHLAPKYLYSIHIPIDTLGNCCSFVCICVQCLLIYLYIFIQIHFILLFLTHFCCANTRDCLSIDTTLIDLRITRVFPTFYVFY